MALERFDSAKSAHQPVQSNRRVLYVEDDDTNWDVAVLGLGKSYLLERALTAKEAFERVKGRDYDAILMDIELAGSEYNGIEITQLLRGLKPGAKASPAGLPRYQGPIVFVTAYNARYSKEDLVAAGGDELIPKPVEFARLALTLSRLLVQRILKK